MKRLAILATVVGGLAVGIAAACSDTVAPPTAAPTGVASAAYLRSGAGQVQFSCGFFGSSIGWRYGLTPQERERIAATCRRLAERLIPLIPLDRQEICDAIMEDPAFDYLPQRIRDAIGAFCSQLTTGTP
jgi:hypothetical protein